VGALVSGDPAALLRRAGGSVKTAVVMGKLGVTRARAEQLLAAAGGRLRKVIGSASGGEDRRDPEPTRAGGQKR
jgi:N-acetylmuramic acid 6-phosphate (MurNAc-6-P) etherase